MEATIEDNIAGFKAAMLEYMKFTSKTPQEALERKVKNIGIRLYHGFQRHQFGGMPRNRNIAQQELDARTAGKRGTRLRPALLQQYRAQRQSLTRQRTAQKKQRGAFGGTLDQWSAMQSASAANSQARKDLWNQIVEKEVHLRQSGVGELGAAFLWSRFRGKGDAKRVVSNRQGKTIGSISVDDGAALIEATLAGINVVDARYGIVTQAIAAETADTLEYVKKRQDDEAKKLLGGAMK